MLWASYIGIGWSQDLDPNLAWKSTRIYSGEKSDAMPTRAQKDEWLGLLPSGNHVNVVQRLTRNGEKGSERLATWSAEEGLRSARILENQLRKRGWLDAFVEAMWVKAGSGVALELTMFPGNRWNIDTVFWHAEGSGISPSRIAAVSDLMSGQPLDLEALQVAQDRIAEYAQALGYYTLNASHIRFEVDTLGRSENCDALVHGFVSPWNFRTSEWMSQSARALDSNEVEMAHPKVFVGDVTWNHESPVLSNRPGGLRSDVWQHLMRVEPGQAFKPQNFSSTYARLLGLPSVRQVMLSQTLRWDTSATEFEVGMPGRAVMDVDWSVVPERSHDLGLEVNMVKNDARYGPKVGATLAHRNPRGWGAENAWELGFGYVAVSPFASLSSQALLNSGEWTLRWGTQQLGIYPFPLSWFKASASPFTAIDLGVDREVWPEFTRSQFHLQHVIGFTENPDRESQFRFAPLEVSFVNLSNRDAAFVAWLEDEANPLIRTRFNNHFTLGTSASWQTRWSWKAWQGNYRIQSSWSGMIIQRLAESWDARNVDPESGAWMIAEDVPSIQHQRILQSFQGRLGLRRNPKWSNAFHVLAGFANAGKNTLSLPLEQAFFTGGANGVRGWPLRSLGPGNVGQQDSSLAILGVGDVRLDLQWEFRYSLNDSWNLAWFADAGNVWLHGLEAPEPARIRRDFWKTLGLSTGVGIRYDLDFFLVRIDAGLRLHDPTQLPGNRWIGQGPSRGALHLGLGLPF